MDRVIPRTDLDAARKSIDEALKNLYVSRVILSKQFPDWPIKIRRLESELIVLLDEIELKESGGRVSSWWTKR
jgi:hypothetical protein